MALRKSRNMTMGKSSTDIRTALENKTERKERLPIYKSVYPYHEAQLKLPRVKTFPNIIKDPILSQTQYYKSINKPLLLRQTLTLPKPSDFDLIHSSTSEVKHFSRSPKPHDTEVQHKKTLDKYHVSKEIEHKKASQETQLVHIAHQSTLEGKVDLKKVADIRRTIRRRYANRNDFRKIFNQWDENAVGVLTAEDINRMVNRIGIPINLNEAKVLVASANLSNTGSLNLNEFMQLIFDQDDKLNVDLSLLNDENGSNLNIIDMHAQAVNKHTQMIQNQLKTFLKERYFGLAPQFIRKDKKKTGKVTFEEFVSILNNMNLPQQLSSEKSWSLLYKEVADDKGLNYERFLKMVDGFEKPNTPESRKSVADTNRKEINEYAGRRAKEPEEGVREQKEEAYQEPVRFDPLNQLNILNRQKVTVNQLDNFFVRARKIRLFLRDSSEGQPALVEELRKRAKGSNVISLEELKDFVIDKLQEKQTVKITKKELEGFLSSYIYNQDGVTQIDEVAKNIFIEDTKASFELHQFRRAIPPIRQTAQFDPSSASGLKPLLLHLENKFYNQGSQKAKEIFKQFDRDRDGYITEEDLSKALVVHQIPHKTSDVKDLMAFIDKDQKGFITFSEFSKVVQPNIITVNKERLNENPEKHAENFQPSLEFLKTQQRSLTHFSKLQGEYIKDFKPDEKIIKVQSSTRYGSNPEFQNTFVHYHMPLKTSLSQELIVPKRFMPFNIGAEEKLKKISVEQQRVEFLRRNREERAERVEGIERMVENRDLQKIYKRAISKDEYEKRCKMSSPFANMSID